MIRIKIIHTELNEHFAINCRQKQLQVHSMPRNTINSWCDTTESAQCALFDPQFKLKNKAMNSVHCNALQRFLTKMSFTMMRYAAVFAVQIIFIDHDGSKF